MRKILILIGLLISLAGYGQAVVNSRVMLDTLNGMRTNAGDLADYAVMLVDSVTTGSGHYITPHQLTDSLDALSGGSWDSVYVHYRIDSLSNVVEELQTDIDNIWNAIAQLGDLDLVAPRFSNAEVGAYDEGVVLVLLDTTDVQQDSIPLVSAFTLWSGAAEHGIASIDINRDSLFIALDSVAVFGRTYTLDYTRGTPALQDSSGNKTANWTARSVTNNVEAPPPPSMISNGTFDDGTDWTYDAGFSITGGKAAYAGTVNTGLYQSAANMNSPIVINTDYTLTLTLAVTGYTYGQFAIISADGGASYVASDQYASGTVVINFTTPADISAGGIAIYAYSIAEGETWTIDNVELEITP